MLSINTNLSSLIVQGNLKQSTNSLNTAIERMTTGYKINHASDNAANYSIKTNMDTKIGAYQVAEENAMMGLDMVTTASETINEMQNHAQRLRALAINARNGTYGSTSLIALQEEACALIDEVDRLYSTTEFNGIKLLNQKEYDLPDGMPKADPVTGFIEDPYDYTESEIANMTPISEVDSFVSGAFYSISSAAELKHFADLVNAGNSGLSSTFVLAEDIDLSVYSQGEGWNPIGNDTNPFRGTFNGNGHIVSNLVINRSGEDHQGMFGYSEEEVQFFNLGLENINIKAGSNVGLLVGSNRASKIENCYAKGDINAKSNVGLLAGYSNFCSINKCYVEGEVYATANWVGGLVGSCWSSVENSYAKANVVSTANIVGGLVGYLALGEHIYNSFSECTVRANVIAGGLVGRVVPQSSQVLLENCCSLSEVLSNGVATGSFIGRIPLDSADLSKLEIVNCKTKGLSMNDIGEVLISSSEYTGDVSIWLSQIENLELKNIDTSLQIGTKGKSNSQMAVNTNFEYDLNGINSSCIESNYALLMIDYFTNLLSEKQTALGAVSNRLESVLEEINVQYENLVSSRSTIQDADMSEVSATYIQQQILQQASATLMATANQTPAIALQLI